MTAPGSRGREQDASPPTPNIVPRSPRAPGIYSLVSDTILLLVKVSCVLAGLILLTSSLTHDTTASESCEVSAFDTLPYQSPDATDENGVFYNGIPVPCSADFS